MKQTLKITNILPQRSGTSKAGNQWIVQEFLVETDGNYPKTIMMQVYGTDKVNDFVAGNYIVGDIVDIDFDIESREYNGKYYTQVSAWRIVKHTDGAETPVAPQSQQEVQPTVQPQATPTTQSDLESDLPF